MLAFAAWSAVTIAWANSTISVTHHTLVWGGYIVFYLLARQITASPKSLRLSLYSLGALVWVLAIPAVVEYFTLVDRNFTTTLGLRYSSYAEAVNVILPLFLLVSVRVRNRRLFWLSAATVWIGWMMINVSFSRAALLCGLCGIGIFAVYFFLTAKKSVEKQRMAAMLAVLLVSSASTQLQFFSANSTSTFDRMTSASTNASTNARPFLARIALEMFRANPLGGVGADNFGRRVNEYRAEFAADNPEYPHLSLFENEFPKRAHNEYLQILAETGVVGFALFVWFLIGCLRLASVNLNFRRPRLTMTGAAAICGMATFFVSSAVTSFSFRVVPNAVMFFFALALAARAGFAETERVESSAPSQYVRLILPATAALCIALAAFSLVRVISQYKVLQGDAQTTTAEAAAFYQTALQLDADNAAAYYDYAQKLLHDGQPAAAAPHFRAGINKGLFATVNYSYLATAQTLANDFSAAEATMNEAVRIYPKSVFVLTRYAVLLEQNGKTELAAQHYKEAAEIDQKQAIGWRLLLTKGAQAASNNAHSEKKSIEIMDLFPQNAFYAVMDERELLHLEEKQDWNGQNTEKKSD
jgi:O-antigen ligase